MQTYIGDIQNRDHSFLHNVMVGLSSLLNQKIRWKLQLDTGPMDFREIAVPFYIDSIQERYAQDKFTNNSVTDPSNKIVNAPYNLIPRGTLVEQGVSVSSDKITSKRLWCEYNELQEDGTIKTFMAETFWIPLSVEVEVVVLVDNRLDIRKASEAILDTFYKNCLYNIDYKTGAIPCNASFPENITSESLLEYGEDDRKNYSVKFQLEIETSMPSIIESSKTFKGLRTSEYQHNVHINTDENIRSYRGGRLGSVWPDSPKNPEKPH